MSKYLKLPLAVLTAPALVLLWAGPAAAADEPVPSPLSEFCATTPDAPVCALDPARKAAPTGDAAQPDAPPAAPQEATTQTLTVPGGSGTVVPLEVPGDQAPPTGAAPLPAPPGPGGNPEELPENIQATLECLAGVGEDFVEGLTGLLEGTVESVTVEIGDTLMEFTDPANLADFLTDPAGFLTEVGGLLEESIGEVVVDGQELFEESAEQFLACLELLVPEAPQPEPQPEPAKPVAQPAAVSYANCDDARARGAAPVHAGQPGYGAHLDSDNDGVGCEQEAALVSHTPTAAPQLAYTGFDPGPAIAGGAALLSLGTLTLLAARRRS